MKQLVEHATFETATTGLHVMIYETNRVRRYFGSYVVMRLPKVQERGRPARGTPVAYGTLEGATIPELDAACRELIRRSGGEIVRERGLPTPR